MQGLAIFLVVLAHFIGPHTTDGSNYPLFQIISSCHMSFFFFLSGYINQKTNHINDRGISYFIKKKFYSLIIPFVFWSYVGVYFISDYYPKTIDELVEPMMIFPNKHFWFLPVLFAFFIIYMIISRYNKFEDVYGRIVLYLIPSIIIAILGVVSSQYHIIIYAIYLISFFLGDYLSWNENFRSKILNDKVFGLSGMLLFITWKVYPLNVDGVAWKSFLNLFMNLVCSYGMCIFCYNFFRKVTLPKPLKYCLKEMGKMSLVIYVTPFVLLSKSYHFPITFNETLINVLSVFMTSIYVFLSYAWGWVIYKIPIVRMVMYGKK